VQVLDSKEVANHVVPESCASHREVRREALTGVRIDQPLSHDRPLILGADVVTMTEGNMGECAIASTRSTRRGHRPWQVRMLLVREPGDLGSDQPPRRLARILAILVSVHFVGLRWTLPNHLNKLQSACIGPCTNPWSQAPTQGIWLYTRQKMHRNQDRPNRCVRGGEPSRSQNIGKPRRGAPCRSQRPRLFGILRNPERIPGQPQVRLDLS
jgi:hypothetical protein